MKKVFLTIGLLFAIQSLYCQTESIGSWLISVNAGIEAHDKRLFDYAENESLLARQPEYWGTYHIGANLQRRLLTNNRFGVYGGLGLKYELASFRRPFDQRDFGDLTLPLLYQDRYRKYTTPLSLLTVFNLSNNLFITSEIEMTWLLYRSITNSKARKSIGPYQQATVELDDINLKLGINYQWKSLLLGLNSRVVNYQKIDKIIFNRIISDPRVDEKWEWYNPLRFDLTVGYTW